MKKLFTILILTFAVQLCFGQNGCKGNFYIQPSFPLINSFRFVPKDEGVMANTGFIGLALGFGYYHSENQFVHFEGTAVAGEQFRTATYGQMSSFYISLSNIHQIKWFKFGYGLSYAILNEWYYRHWVFPLTLFESGVKKRHSSFGFNFPIYLELNERLNIGISYRPTFYRPNLINKFEYEHVISFGLALNIMY